MEMVEQFLQIKKFYDKILKLRNHGQTKYSESKMID